MFSICLVGVGWEWGSCRIGKSMVGYGICLGRKVGKCMLIGKYLKKNGMVRQC